MISKFGFLQKKKKSVKLDLAVTHLTSYILEN